jgi:fibronectin type 3 domain-containing protein
MGLNIGGIKKFKPNRGHLPIAAWAVVSIIVVVVGVHLLFSSHAATTLPTTASLQNMCGVTSTYDASSYTPPVGQAPVAYADGDNTIAAYPKFLAAQGGAYQPNQLSDFHIQTVSGTAYLFTLNSPVSTGNYTISISTLASPSTRLLTFPIMFLNNNPAQFTVDPLGNIYIMSWFATGGPSTPVLYQYSPFSGSTLSNNTALAAAHSINLPFYPIGGVFGYVNSSGSFTVGLDQSIANQGSSQYNAVATAQLYNTSLTNIGTNNIDAPNGTQQAANGDLTSVDNGMLYVYTNSGQLKFSMGTGNSPGTSLSLARATSAIENTDGTYDIIGSSMGTSKFSSTGTYLGSSPNFNDQNNASNTMGVNSEHLTQFNGIDYYYSQGLNVWATAANNHTPGIFSITPAQLAIYTSYPQGTNGILGLGAGLTTQASISGSKIANNYFPSGTNPSVNLALYPWWSGQISSYIITYEVRNMDQINANLPGTTQTVTVSSLSPTSPSYIPLNLAGNTTPGAYEISAHISKAGKIVGSDCLDYSVGAPGSAYNPSGANFSSPVEQAHELGQNLVRSDSSLTDCLPAVDANSTTLTVLPTIDCSKISASVISEANLAKQYGMTYVLQISGHTNALDKTLVNTKTTSCPGYKTGVSISMWECLTYQMALALPSVNTWMDYNEFNNTIYGNPADTVNNLIIPAYSALKAAGTKIGQTETAIGGSLLGGQNVSYLKGMITAGALNYMDGFDVHPYPGDNRSYEEQGEIIPSLNANPGESTTLGLLDQMRALLGGKSLSDSEFGVWQSGQSSTYGQGDVIVRATILQNSIGMTNLSVFLNSGCYQTAGVNWGTIGCGQDGGDKPAVTAQVTMQRMLDGPTVPQNRKFVQWLPTGIPHTYAALYGPSGTDTGSVAIVWASDFTTSVIPILSGAGSMNVTSEYGASSVLVANSTLPISGQVKYINVPVGQTITFKPSETFGPNLALKSATNNVTVTASSTAASGSCNANNVVLGLDDILNLPSCGPSQTNGWAESPSDASPSITVKLPTTQNINRLFMASSSIHSVDSNIRNATVQVSSDGTNWITVGTITDNFFQRSWSLSFASQSVSQIRVTYLSSNFSGYAGGLAPVWWPISAIDMANPSKVNYGPAQIYDIEAYGPGSSMTITTPPIAPNAPTGVTATVKSGTSVALAWIASTDSSTTSQISGYNIFRGGTQVNTAPIIGTSYTDTSAAYGTSYSYTVQAVDNASPANLSPQSVVASVTTYPKPSTPVLTTTATNSSTVTLNWTASVDTGGPGIAAYYITRTNGTTTLKFTVNSPALTYVDSSVSPNTAYSYTIQSADTVAGLSVISLPSSVTTPSSPDTTAPSVPAISIGSSLYNSVTINWTASIDNVGGSGLASYTLYRNGAVISTLNSSTLTYLDNTVSPSTAYNYTVSATDNAGNTSAKSLAAITTTPAKPIIFPTAPSNLTGSATTATSTKLSWIASTDTGGPGLVGYYILRTTSGSSTAVNIGNTASLNYTDNTAAPSTTYSYQIQAYDSANPPNVSPSSNSLNLTTPAAPQVPTAPNSLTATPTSTSQINLAWNASANTTSYNIYQIGVTAPIATGITTTSYGITGLFASTSYSYYVTAINSVGPSPNSSTVSATTLANPTCPTGQTGTPPNCVTPVTSTCPSGDTGTYPNCIAPSSSVVTLTGIVTDSSGKPIAGANVKTGKNAIGYGYGGASATTNANGVYILTGMSPTRSHYYYFSATGHTTLQVTKSYPAGVSVLNVTLK